MPSRILRESLVRSQRWLDLKDNQDRLAFILCILNADDLGNFEANPGDLVRLWRDIGAVSTEYSAKIARELADADLVRWYAVDGKRYGHIPRFRQRLRYIKRACPRPDSETECKEIKAILYKETDLSQTKVRPQSDCSRPEVEVEVEVDTEEVQKLLVNAKALPQVSKRANGKARATRLAEGWRLPYDWRDWAVSAHHLEPDRVVRLSVDFRDYWHAKPSDATKLDWFATWRRWVRKDCGNV